MKGRWLLRLAWFLAGFLGGLWYFDHQSQQQRIASLEASVRDYIHASATADTRASIAEGKLNQCMAQF